MADMISIPYLRYIVEVAESGSISKASDKLFISQPYLSRVIKETEDRLGIVIFSRGKNGVITTHAGEEFIYQAKAVISQYDQFEKAFSPQMRETDFLRISVQRSSHTFEAFVRFINSLEDGKSRRIDFYEGKRNDVFDDVAGRRADVGIFACVSDNYGQFEKIAEKRNMTIKPLCSMKQYVVCSENHPLAKRGGPVRTDELLEYGMIIYGDRNESGISIADRATSSDWMDASKIKSVISVYDRGSQISLLSYTDYFIIGVRDFDAQREMFHVVTLPIDCEGDENAEKRRVVFCLLTLNDKYMSPSAKDFIQTAEEYFSRFNED